MTRMRGGRLPVGGWKLQISWDGMIDDGMLPAKTKLAMTILWQFKLDGMTDVARTQQQHQNDVNDYGDDDEDDGNGCDDVYDDDADQNESEDEKEDDYDDDDDDEEEKEQHDDHEEEDSDGDEDKDNLENFPSEHEGTSKVPRINHEKQESRTISSKIVSHLLFANLLHIYFLDFTHQNHEFWQGVVPNVVKFLPCEAQLQCLAGRPPTHS